jgi:hypothetical protein
MYVFHEIGKLMTKIDISIHVYGSPESLLMIRIGIIGSNAKRNNKEYVDFIVCKRITSVNIINGNTMQNENS